ncbi:hypothetical protein TYRP_010643 [Tyrophagus putrescentiae]|nr:hypothetical protein TYRP_010643 [Tyrophagus putrescentiae]
MKFIIAFAALIAVASAVPALLHAPAAVTYHNTHRSLIPVKTITHTTAHVAHAAPLVHHGYGHGLGHGALLGHGIGHGAVIGHGAPLLAHGAPLALGHGLGHLGGHGLGLHGGLHGGLLH